MNQEDAYIEVFDLVADFYEEGHSMAEIKNELMALIDRAIVDVKAEYMELEDEDEA